MRGPAAARRRRARRRRLDLGSLTLLGPGLLVIATDLARRGSLIRGFDRPHLAGWLVSAFASLALWGLLLHAASRRRRGGFGAVARLVFVVTFTLSVGLSAGFYGLFGLYLGQDAQLAMLSIPRVVTGAMPMTRLAVVVPLVIAFGVALAFVRLARRFVRPRASLRRVAPALVAVALHAAFELPASYTRLQATTPDLIYLHGLGQGVREHLGLRPGWEAVFVQRRSPEPVPRIEARPARPRNVLLVLQESERFDVTCVAYDPDCPLATRASNAAMPGRIPLLEMRSNDSATAISLSTLASGVAPTASRGELLSAPLVWEYAKAGGLRTAYWTSQHLMFGNSRLYIEDLPLDSFFCASHLDWQAEIFAGADDAALSDRAAREIQKLGEPFFAVAHYSNNHIPRRFDPANAPFQPSEEATPARPTPEHANYYKNVVYLSDLGVGRLVDSIRRSPIGERTVVVYTSDHGESYREHGQGGDHSASLFDEEIHVPAWIDAPAGTLAPEEEASLRSARQTPVFHVDLAATLLDLIGVWDANQLASFRARMPGHPLTRPERTTAALPISNVSWVWEDSQPSWGIMQGKKKLFAMRLDPAYRCYDVERDPGELNDLGPEACGPLWDAARALYVGIPRETPGLKDVERTLAP